VTSERLAASSLQARLRGIGAQFYPDRSSNAAHIYYSAPRRQWLKVYKDRSNPSAVVVEYHATCPCSKV